MSMCRSMLVCSGWAGGYSPLNKVQVVGQCLPLSFALELLLLLQMGAHDIVEVAVGLCASGHGGRRRAIDELGLVLWGLDDGFYALDVSGARLQHSESIHVHTTYPFQDGGLTLGCSRRDSRRRCLGFSTGLTARGTNEEYQEASSYMAVLYFAGREYSELWPLHSPRPRTLCGTRLAKVGLALGLAAAERGGVGGPWLHHGRSVSLRRLSPCSLATICCSPMVTF